MTRSFHIAYKSPGGTRRDEKITSFDTYEQAKQVAQTLYNRMAPDSEIEIRSAGVIVWGPYVKGAVV